MIKDYITKLLNDDYKIYFYHPSLESDKYYFKNKSSNKYIKIILTDEFITNDFIQNCCDIGYQSIPDKHEIYNLINLDLDSYMCSCICERSSRGILEVLTKRIK